MARQSCTASRTSPSTLPSALHDLGAHGFVGDRLEVEMDEALARIAGGVRRAERHELAAVALDAEHRMRHQPHVEPALGEFAHHRVDQERHVVVDDLDDA